MAVVRPSPDLARRVLGPSLPGPRALWNTAGRRAVSAAACVALPLALGVALGRPDLGSAAGLAGFTAIYGHALPFRRRAIVVAGVGAALLVAFALGTLVGSHALLLAPVLGLLVAAASAATAIWRIGPPGPLGVVLVGGGASALGAGPGAFGPHLLAALGGVLLSWLVCMLPWLWDPAGPERRAVAAADAAVDAAERGTHPTGRPDPAAHAVRVAHAAVADGSRRRPSLAPDLLAIEERFFRALPHGDIPLEPARLERVAEPRDRWTAPWLPGALRAGLAAAAAGLLAVALGLSSSYWASTTAVAVLLGADVRATGARAAHRTIGTLLGIAIAAGLLALHLPVGVQVLLVGLLQMTVELLIAFQYVLAVSAITPLALLLVHVGNPARPVPELIGTRLAETVVGIVVALVAGFLLFRRASSRRLPAAVSRTGAVVVAAAGGEVGDRTLRDALVALYEVATGARAELSPAPGTPVWLRRSRRTADLGWTLLATRAQDEHELAAQVAAAIHADLR
ncbi:FUSC family protein [Petropleomorpha daqingensis]|uniref:Putative flippase GtrA n=1 Tax=Petropleomorpha daqingensis TaxID=2026353 RepID=A0A853CFM6_9ACTN|nr:FUSC family protein [Petropleomorpha daqingensis]NYJ06775.1 putative flippase GtrA [Petropleomorpha daqingensis]